MRVLKRSAFLFVVATFLFSSICLSPSSADDYPTRPITLIVPWGAGGITDILARASASGAGPFLSQPLVILNKPGATGTLGISLIAGSKPDGYTIGAATPSFSVVPHFHPVDYDLAKDFTYIVALASFKESFFVRADSPFKTLDDLLQYARQNPNKVRIGCAGLGGSVNVMLRLIAQKAGVKWTEVPFGGADVESITALLGGHVDAAGAAGAVFPYARAGQLRVLSFSTSERVKEFPNVPTLQELGYNYVGISYSGIVGPKGLPEAICQKLEDVFKKSRESAPFRETVEKLVLSPRYEVGNDFKQKMLEYYKLAGDYLKK